MHFYAIENADRLCVTVRKYPFSWLLVSVDDVTRGEEKVKAWLVGAWKGRRRY